MNKFKIAFYCFVSFTFSSFLSRPRQTTFVDISSVYKEICSTRFGETYSNECKMQTQCINHSLNDFPVVSQWICYFVSNTIQMKCTRRRFSTFRFRFKNVSGVIRMKCFHSDHFFPFIFRGNVFHFHDHPSVTYVHCAHISLTIQEN